MELTELVKKEEKAVKKAKNQIYEPEYLDLLNEVKK